MVNLIYIRNSRIHEGGSLYANCNLLMEKYWWDHYEFSDRMLKIALIKEGKVSAYQIFNMSEEPVFDYLMDLNGHRIVNY